ncbi:pyridoxamine 5'-phosphate oxidase family protein [Candidatus Latescibacterota bacterium]
MDLKQYFDSAHGIGVLATADADGNVDVAQYTKPHFMENGSIAFIMSHKLSYKNLQANSHCAYIFIETGEKKSGSGGIRLYLEKTSEEQDQDKIIALRRKNSDNLDSNRSIVFFNIERTRALLGDGTP